MKSVIFVDTSVMLNLLDVPGKNSHRDEVRATFKQHARGGEVLLILPVTTIIETGNHIAQLDHRGLSRQRAERLCDFLRQSQEGRPPWTISGSRWDESALSDLVQGADNIPSLPDLASQKVGAGDAAILHERRRYLARADVPSNMPVTIWTYDNGLRAHA